MKQVKPKKALGQHFLTDLSVAARIAATLDDYIGMPVVEVGPGMGVLTAELVARGHDLRVVEIDRESIAYLTERFPALAAEGRIIEGDFLRLPVEEIVPGDGKFCVIGNYPYNISSQIFFRVLDWRDRVAVCSGMLQREVAERLTAPAGTKARGILSVLLQMWYDTEYLFTVSEHVFNPPPKVKSGVMRMCRNDVTDPGCDWPTFRTLVKTVFGQRRKTLRNSLRPLLPPGMSLPDDCALAAMRPEQLTVEQFVELTQMVSEMRRRAPEKPEQ